MDLNITFAAQKQPYDPWTIPETYTLFQMAPDDIRHFLHPHWHNQKAPHPVWFYALGLWYFALSKWQMKHMAPLQTINSTNVFYDPVQWSSEPSVTTASFGFSAAHLLCVRHLTCWSWTWRSATCCCWSPCCPDAFTTFGREGRGDKEKLFATLTPFAVLFDFKITCLQN